MDNNSVPQQEQQQTSEDSKTDGGIAGVTFEVVEGEVEGGKPVRRRGIYLLPNLFTTGVIFGGFYAIVAAMNGQYSAAALALFVSGLLDGLDGRVARLTHTQSAFGVEYDSLSDLVAFGVAPAILMYSWSLAILGKVGWVIAFMFTACTALRLARFNTQSTQATNAQDNRYFTGLASPPAAALITFFVWSCAEMNVSGQSLGLAVVSGVLTFLAAMLMVSNIRYYSFKQIDFKGRVPFVMIFFVLLLFAVVFIDPPKVLFCFAIIYAASGPVWLVKQKVLDH